MQGRLTELGSLQVSVPERRVREVGPIEVRVVEVDLCPVRVCGPSEREVEAAEICRLGPGRVIGAGRGERDRNRDRFEDFRLELDRQGRCEDLLRQLAQLAKTYLPQFPPLDGW